MCWVQIISRKGQWDSDLVKASFEIKLRVSRAGFGRARFQSCRNDGKLMGLSPLRMLSIPLESSETVRQIPSFKRWKRYSPDCIAICREWQKCPLPFV